MSSDDDFGPQLPPELAAKRNAAKKSGPVGPARPYSRSPSPVRINVGPSLPPSHAGPSRPVGPSVGPSLPAGRSVGPSLPPGPSSVGPVGPSPPPGRSVGPAPPPADDSDSDDEVGPKLSDATAAPTKSAAELFKEREERWARERSEREAAAKNKAPQRDDWMLAPPTGGVLSNLDPLKRPTSFNKTSRAGVTADEQRGWTETPAERAQREADERAGVKRRRGKEEEEEIERKRIREKEREMREQIERHSVSPSWEERVEADGQKGSRGASLLEQHQEKKKKTAEEDEPPAIWDHDKMMGVTGRMLTDQERAKKIKDARQLNDRFGHGKSGAYM